VYIVARFLLDLSQSPQSLLEQISEYAVWAYTTPDSALSYLNHAQIAQSRTDVICFIKHDCS